MKIMKVPVAAIITILNSILSFILNLIPLLKKDKSNQLEDCSCPEKDEENKS